jgi:hypothetical protein
MTATLSRLDGIAISPQFSAFSLANAARITAQSLIAGRRASQKWTGPNRRIEQRAES